MSVKPQTEAPSPVVIKKYANRRLYNTSTSSYVTLDNLSQMIRAGTDFVVFDAKTGEEITRSVLTQIIVEEEQKGENLLPISFLRQLIGFYGNNMQWMVPPYLEGAMKAFASHQEQLRQNMVAPGFGGLFKLGSFEEVSKRNMAVFERMMRLWTPALGDADPAGAIEPETPSMAEAEVGTAASIRDLSERLNALQNQLETLTKEKLKE